MTFLLRLIVFYIFLMFLYVYNYVYFYLVQIALSALTAEKEALKAKLAFIDQQLESDSKKKVAKGKK